MRKSGSPDRVPRRRNSCCRDVHGALGDRDIDRHAHDLIDRRSSIRSGQIYSSPTQSTVCRSTAMSLSFTPSTFIDSSPSFWPKLTCASLVITCVHVLPEAAVCRARRLDSARVIDRQMARYRQAGFPAWYGLNHAAVILRRHSAAMKNFNQQWWQEICPGSRRDQLSFNYVLWKVGLPIAEFPLSIQDNNGLSARVAHARRRPLRQSGRPDLQVSMLQMEAFISAPRRPNRPEDAPRGAGSHQSTGSGAPCRRLVETARSRMCFRLCRDIPRCTLERDAAP